MGVIYKITNTINGKAYVGKTLGTVAHRWGQHKACVTKSKGDCYLYRAMRKHGFENFAIEVIDSALLDEHLCEKEIFWIAKLGTTNRKVGYNSTFGGQSGVPTPEVREKMKGRPCSIETRRKIAEANRGRTVSAEARKTMSLARKGKPVSPERAVAMKANPPGLGKRRSEESKRKTSESHRRLWTPEYRARHSERQRASRAQKPRLGSPMTEENKVKMSERQRIRWASMTVEERSRRAAPSLQKAQVTLKNPEIIAKRNAAIKAAWTEEKRAAWAIKMRPRLIEQNNRLVEAARARRAA